LQLYKASEQAIAMQQSHLTAERCVWFRHHVTAMMSSAFSMQQCMPFCVHE